MEEGREGGREGGRCLWVFKVEGMLNPPNQGALQTKEPLWLCESLPVQGGRGVAATQTALCGSSSGGMHALRRFNQMQGMQRSTGHAMQGMQCSAGHAMQGMQPATQSVPHRVCLTGCASLTIMCDQPTPCRAQTDLRRWPCSSARSYTPEMPTNTRTARGAHAVAVAAVAAAVHPVAVAAVAAAVHIVARAVRSHCGGGVG